MLKSGVIQNDVASKNGTFSFYSDYDTIQWKVQMNVIFGSAIKTGRRG